MLEPLVVLPLAVSPGLGGGRAGREPGQVAILFAQAASLPAAVQMDQPSDGLEGGVERPAPLTEQQLPGTGQKQRGDADHARGVGPEARREPRNTPGRPWTGLGGRN